MGVPATPAKTPRAAPGPLPSYIRTPPLLRTPPPTIQGHYLPSYLDSARTTLQSPTSPLPLPLTTLSLSPVTSYYFGWYIWMIHLHTYIQTQITWMIHMNATHHTKTLNLTYHLITNTHTKTHESQKKKNLNIQ